MSELRQAFRFLLRSPGFVLVAVFSLALGIGASTAIFSVVNAVLLRPLPVPAPRELRQLAWQGRSVGVNNYSGGIEKGSERDLRLGPSFPYPADAKFETAGEGLSSLFAFSSMPRTIVSARGEASVTAGAMVSGNFFAGYGGSAILGRPFLPDDEKPGAPLVGVPLALVLGRVLRSWLHEIEPTDFSVLLGVCLVLFAAALATVWGPARRAARIDPVQALRAE